MDVCLLCLESKKEIVECINFNSDKWNQQNLHELIEKHLWPIETINPLSWMCIKCGEELYGFHKFYKRIEEAHKSFNTLFKHEDELSILDENDLCDTESVKSKDYFKGNVFDENDLEENISVQSPIINEFVLESTFVKIEKREELNTENEKFSENRRRKKISLNKGNDLYDTGSIETKDHVFDKNDLKECISVEPPVINECVLDDPFAKIEKIEELNTENGKYVQNRTRSRPKKIRLKKTEENNLSHTDGINSKHDVKDNIFDENALEENISVEPPVVNGLALDDPFVKIEKGKELNTKNGAFSKNRKRGRPRKISVNKDKEEIDLHNKNKEKLKEYDKIIAENFKLFCNICQTALDNFVNLRKHCKMEHKTRGYARCCKRNFYTRALLVDHINVHLNREYFKCQHCSKVFSDRSRLQCHKKFHDDTSNLDKCEKCGKLFADKSTFKRHKLTHFSKKSFPCNICGRWFSSVFLLNNHIETIHENKFAQICEICGKSIRRPTAFARHMETHDTNTLPVSCDVCGLILSNKEGLKVHKNAQHPEGGKKEHACRICLKISPTERALKAHIRSVHEQGPDLKCSVCEKSFKRPGALKEHEATHTGRPLYTCLWCPRTFISNSNMYNHRKSAHPKEWEELKRQRYIGNKL